MDVTVSNGKIQIQNDNNGHVKSLSAYICKPDRSILCRISGIERFLIKAKFNDISEIQFNVSKYIVGEGSLSSMEYTFQNWGNMDISESTKNQILSQKVQSKKRSRLKHIRSRVFYNTKI